MNPTYSPEYETKCRNKLESLGFVFFSLENLLEASIDGSHYIDFSATDPEKYVEFAMREMYNLGYSDGEKHIKDQMNKLLGR